MGPPWRPQTRKMRFGGSAGSRPVTYTAWASGCRRTGGAPPGAGREAGSAPPGAGRETGGAPPGAGREADGAPPVPEGVPRAGYREAHIATW